MNVQIILLAATWFVVSARPESDPSSIIPSEANQRIKKHLQRVKAIEDRYGPALYASRLTKVLFDLEILDKDLHDNFIRNGHLQKQPPPFQPPLVLAFTKSMPRPNPREVLYGRGARLLGGGPHAPIMPSPPHISGPPPSHDKFFFLYPDKI